MMLVEISSPGSIVSMHHRGHGYYVKMVISESGNWSLGAAGMVPTTWRKFGDALIGRVDFWDFLAKNVWLWVGQG